MARSGFKIEGLRDIDRVLRELPKATARNVLKRVGIELLEPIAEDMRRNAPVAEENGGELRDSIGVGTQLTPRQASLARKGTGRMTADGYRSDPKTSVDVHAGAGSMPEAHMSEYGTEKQPPRPWARPAWDRGAGPLLERAKDKLGNEVTRAAQRLAKKRAR